jgi:hypothetical protein
MESKGSSIGLSTSNPDLTKERNNPSFNTKEITEILDGGPDKTKFRRETGILLLYSVFPTKHGTPRRQDPVNLVDIGLSHLKRITGFQLLPDFI